MVSKITVIWGFFWYQPGNFDTCTAGGAGDKYEVCSTENYLQNCAFVMQNWVCLPGSPHQDVSMDVFNWNPCDKAGVCVFDVLVTLFDWSFGQDAQRNPHFVLGPLEVEHSMGYQKMNISSHLLVKSGRPKVKNPPCIFLKNIKVMEHWTTDCQTP